MNQITNNSGFGLSMAVWLAHDTYSNGQEEQPDENVISATSLLKPVRQLILANRLPKEEHVVDVADMIPSRFGHAIHDSIEEAWTKGYSTAMARLGYSQKVIDRVKINPEPEELDANTIPVYLEQRFFRKIAGVTISGKFDSIIDGELNDVKTTSVYTYINRSKTEDYQLQGSIYRWINPEKVTSDVMRIQHVFTDWQRAQAKINPDYPQNRVIEFKVELLSLERTEAWIYGRLREIAAQQDLPEDQLTRCTDKELWKSDPVYKFYADPAKAAEGGRSTKNFSTYPEAAQHASKAGKGVVITVPGTVKACGYCSGAPLCTQRLEYEQDNERP